MLPRSALRPNWYLLITVASWGLNFVAVKEAYKEISAPALALLRTLVMWGCLVLVCWWRKEPLRPEAKDRLRILYLGFVSLGVYMVLFLEGMRGSGATEGAILLQTSPIFTAMLSAAFKQERWNTGTLVGAALAFGGTALVIQSPGGRETHHLVSNLIVLLSAFMWAYSITVMRPLLMRYSPLQVLTLSMPGALPVMLVYGLVPSLHQHWGAVSHYGWLMFFHIAVISGVVAFLCFYEGVRSVGGTGAALYQYLVPAAAMFFAALIQGAVPSWVQVAGFLIVLAGVGYASRARFLSQAAA